MSVVAGPAGADQYKPWVIAQIAWAKVSCVQVVFKCCLLVLGDLAKIAALAVFARRPCRQLDGIPTTG